MRYYLSPPPANPASRILAGLLAVLVLVGAFFFGLIVLGVAVALGILAWIVLSVRMWWVGRQWEKRGADAGTRRAKRQGAENARARDAIDADYEVISRRKDD